MEGQSIRLSGQSTPKPTDLFGVKKAQRWIEISTNAGMPRTLLGELEII